MRNSSVARSKITGLKGDHRSCCLMSRGCLGCCIEVPVSVPIDDPSKRPGTSQARDDTSTSDSFWSSGINEIDRGAALSQNNGEGSETSHPESVKPGLLLWNRMRQEWLETTVPRRETFIQEPKINWNATYESLLDPDRPPNGPIPPFPEPIPLKEMVDFLVDVWEQEGLYD